MKYIKTYENMNDKITVKIKPNIHNKPKWYYKDHNDLTNKIIVVKNSYNPIFDEHYCYDDSYYIDKEDCEYIGTNIDRYNI